MNLPAELDRDVVQSAKNTWNILSEIFDEDPSIYQDPDTFFPIYKEMVVSLFKTTNQE